MKNNFKSCLQACKKGNKSQVLKLLALGYNPSYNNYQAIHVAIKYHHLDIIKLFIDAGINLDKSKAIIKAIEYGHIDIFYFLIEYGANPLINDSEALISAVLNGCLEEDPNDNKYIDVIKYFISKGANVNSHDTNTVTCAIYGDNYVIMKLLIDAGVNYSCHGDIALTQASIDGNINTIKVLLEAGAKPSFENLIDAIETYNSNIKHDKIKTIELLLSSDTIDITEENFKAFHIAIKLKEYHILSLLENKFIEYIKKAFNTKLNILSKLNVNAVQIIRHWSHDGEKIAKLTLYNNVWSYYLCR